MQRAFGIPLGTLIKLFLQSLISHSGVGFYIGDTTVHNLFEKWLRRKHFEKLRGKNAARMPGPLRQDLDLMNKKPAFDPLQDEADLYNDV